MLFMSHFVFDLHSAHDRPCFTSLLQEAGLLVNITFEQLF